MHPVVYAQFTSAHLVKVKCTFFKYNILYPLVEIFMTYNKNKIKTQFKKKNLPIS